MQKREIKTTLIYTNILHWPRKKHWLSLIEYTLCDMIYHLSNNPKYNWCIMSKETMATELWVSRRGIIDIINKMIKRNFIIKDPETNFLKTALLWYNEFVLGCAEIAQGVQNDQSEGVTNGVQDMPQGVQKLHTGCAETSHNIDNDINKDIDIILLSNEENDFAVDLDFWSEDDLIKKEKVAPKRKKEAVVKVFDQESFEYLMAKKFMDGQRHQVSIQYQLTQKPEDDILQTWAWEIEKLKRIDGYSEDKIDFVIWYTLQDPFWKNNVILSVMKYREKKDGIPYFVKVAQKCQWSFQESKEKEKTVTAY